LETYQIKILPTAQKELASLPKAIQVRIGKKIDSGRVVDTCGKKV
jgi:mRNA-degrading endonuclease RelE of RelBE toxin-antitoxin system